MESQNGWDVASVADIHYYQLVGGKVGLRKGDVATVLLAVAADLQRLEPAVWPGIWGWYVRPIRGQTTGYSNHASGTAMDWNAPNHPRQSGSRYLGWSASQVAAIHSLLAGKYKHLVRWGADYVSKPYDPMHFEINGDDSQIAALARQLATPTPAPSPVTGDKMQALAQSKESPALYITDGIYRRWIPGPSYRDDLIAAGVPAKVWTFTTVAGLTAFAGPLAPGTTDYDPPKG